jgi:hypothetical protein
LQRAHERGPPEASPYLTGYARSPRGSPSSAGSMDAKGTPDFRARATRAFLAGSPWVIPRRGAGHEVAAPRPPLLRAARQVLLALSSSLSSILGGACLSFPLLASRGAVLDRSDTEAPRERILNRSGPKEP